MVSDSRGWIRVNVRENLKDTVFNLQKCIIWQLFSIAFSELCCIVYCSVKFKCVTLGFVLKRMMASSRQFSCREEDGFSSAE